MTAIFSRALGKSNEFDSVQRYVFNKNKNELQTYLRRIDGFGFVKHQRFMERPGSGKPLLCTSFFLQALAKGLSCSITCLRGERAQEVGGEHIHQLNKMCFPI